MMTYGNTPRRLTGFQETVLAVMFLHERAHQSLHQSTDVLEFSSSYFRAFAGIQWAHYHNFMMQQLVALNWIVSRKDHRGTIWYGLTHVGRTTVETHWRLAANGAIVASIPF